MGHNTSRTQQEHLRRRGQVHELEQWLVPGWQIDLASAHILPIDTALGYMQRRQQILLRCSRPDCRRRVELDLKSAIEDGRADHSLKQLIGALSCRHWSGCQLHEVHAIYPHGVPLIAYLDGQNSVLIAVTCQGCSVRVVLPPRQMITRLKEAGRGDGSTGVLELGQAVRGPCRRCGRTRFRSEVIQGRAPGT
jgi:hypothetical protein